jgi:hypothetical protein
MSEHGPFQATPREELRRQIMSSSIPKNEREHWAARRIEELERNADAIATALGDALSTFRDDDKTTIITVERQEAWKAALEDYRRIKP